MFLTSSEFNRLMLPFAPFESQPVIAVATSGGPDSLALALLAHQWAKDQGGRAIALTVDHLLRENSTTEAYQVKTWLQSWNMEHHILTWERGGQGSVPKTAIQVTAREARYEILGRWCKDHGVKHLLTAHHGQDQLETFMIRLAKGSGLKGLTGIQPIVPTDFGRILRPLLNTDPDHFKVMLQAFRQPFLMDPSNENRDFTRIRWRQMLPLLGGEGLTPSSIQETLARLNHTQRLVDQHISSLLNQYTTFSSHGYAMLRKECLQESLEAFEEILKRILTAIGTKGYPVRRHALHRAIKYMREGRSFTLGGCQIFNKTKEWWIVREFAAVQKSIFIHQSGTYFWDNRFTVEVSKSVPCHLAALGEKGIQKLKDQDKKFIKNIPHIALKTLPSLWQETELLEFPPSYTFTPHFRLWHSY